jgi:peptide/nickel transport system permease protein
MWWRFKHHKVAFASGVMVVALYLIALFCEFFATALPTDYSSQRVYAPPQRLRFILRDESGTRLQPHVLGYRVVMDELSLRRDYTVDTDNVIPVRFFGKGPSYELWGLIPADRHLIAPVDLDQRIYLWGADRLGRDVYSRVMYGTRISLSIGLVGVGLSLFLGVLLGGVSGYFGGAVDDVIQRIIEFLKSIPTIPLWMGLAAAIPNTWPPLRVYFAIGDSCSDRLDRNGAGRQREILLPQDG